MTVAESKDGVGCLDVVHSDLPLPLPLLAVVAPGEGVDVGLVFPVVVVLGHGPVDWVVLQLESSEQVHGGGQIDVGWADAGGQLVVVTPRRGDL